MHRPSITELFRYYSNVKWALEVIEKQIVFCPKPEHFNDPFDCSIPFSDDEDPAAYVAGVIRIRRKDGFSWAKIRGELNGLLTRDASLTKEARAQELTNAKQLYASNQQMGVLSLTEQPLSVVMWSHYANKHRGVCIGFHRAHNTLLGYKDICLPVTYLDDYPKPRFAELYGIDARLSKTLLYSKAREWSYEREWRLMIDPGDRTESVSGLIIRVILGCRATANTTRRILAACRRTGIRLEVAQMVEGEFALQTTPLFETPFAINDSSK